MLLHGDAVRMRVLSVLLFSGFLGCATAAAADASSATASAVATPGQIVHAAAATCLLDPHNTDKFGVAAAAAAGAFDAAAEASGAGWREQYALYTRFAPGGVAPATRVHASPINGRGLFVGAPVAAGSVFALGWFDYVDYTAPANATEAATATATVAADGRSEVFTTAEAATGLVYKPGFIPAGTFVRAGYQR